MTPEQKSALNRLRDTIVIPGLAGAAAKEIAADAPPADSRPRYSAGPMRGLLKNRRERWEEALGLDDPEANEWLPEAAQDPAWKALHDKYQTLYGAQVLADEKARDEGADMDAAAARLKIAPEKFRSAKWREANAKLIAAAERLAGLRDEQEARAAEMERPLPAEIEPEAPAK